MGAYLSSPITDKDTASGGNESIKYGAAAMQGWRTEMEDAHMVHLDMNSTKTSLFAVFDGHGGKEVARFSAKHIVDVLSSTEGYKRGDFKAGLVEAYLRIDELLCMEANQRELAELARDGDSAESAPPPGSEAAIRMYTDALPEPLQKALQEAREAARAAERGSGGDDDEAASGEGAGRELDMDGNGLGDSTIEEEPALMSPAAQEVTEEEETAHASPAVSKRARQDGHTPLAVAAMERSVGEDGPATPATPEASEVPEEIELGNSADAEEPSTPPPPGGSSDDLPDSPPGRTPGPSAGCTAVVGVIAGGQLYVANAGDSRCVVSRGGTAHAMSEDHKPQHPAELARIRAAGGFVSADGRVNGSLNLSRALGDMEYKQNRSLPPAQQIVTAQPDVRCLPLTPDDEFMVLACDGIWEVMDNQEVITFCREKLNDGATELEVASALCDACCAPDTQGTGHGCDNMSVLVVKLLDGLPRSAK